MDAQTFLQLVVNDLKIRRMRFDVDREAERHGYFAVELGVVGSKRPSKKVNVRRICRPRDRWQLLRSENGFPRIVCRYEETFFKWTQSIFSGKDFHWNLAIFWTLLDSRFDGYEKKEDLWRDFLRLQASEFSQ